MKKRFTEEQIIGFLREAEAGLPVKELCRRHGFSEASYYLWRSKFGGMSNMKASGTLCWNPIRSWLWLAKVRRPAASPTYWPSNGGFGERFSTTAHGRIWPITPRPPGLEKRC